MTCDKTPKCAEPCGLCPEQWPVPAGSEAAQAPAEGDGQSAPAFPFAYQEVCEGSTNQHLRILMGHGRIEVGDAVHEGMPALWFGNDGQGLGFERDRNNRAQKNETLLIITFENIQGLEAIEFAIARVREKLAPTTQPQPKGMPDGYKLLEDGKTMIPEGWTPLRMEWEPGYPEDVAFGPQRLMDRLKKWLDRYFAARVAEAAAQAPAPGADVEGGDLPCPRCNGSGFELQWSDASPDAHQVEVNCDHCDGAGSLGAAYTHLSQMLKRERERSKKHTNELHWLKSGPFFGLRADKSIQTVADRLDELADACGKYDPRSERASDIRAAATIWRKHLAGPAPCAAVAQRAQVLARIAEYAENLESGGVDASAVRGLLLALDAEFDVPVQGSQS